MGSQQLLLVVLAMVLVGVALTVAITMFQTNAIESNRNAMTDDLLYFAGRARDYYWRPISLGGGNRSFIGITTLRMLTPMTENANGRYYLKESEPPTKDKIVIVGRGRVGVGDETTQVEVTVNEQTSTIQVIY